MGTRNSTLRPVLQYGTPYNVHMTLEKRIQEAFLRVGQQLDHIKHISPKRKIKAHKSIPIYC